MCSIQIPPSSEWLVAVVMLNTGNVAFTPRAITLIWYKLCLLRGLSPRKGEV